MPVKFVMNAISTSWSSSNDVMLVLLSAADLCVAVIVEAPVVSGFGRRCPWSTKGNGHRSHTITLNVKDYRVCINSGWTEDYLLAITCNDMISSPLR